VQEVNLFDQFSQLKYNNHKIIEIVDFEKWSGKFDRDRLLARVRWAFTQMVR